MPMQNFLKFDYEFLDCGDGRRLERFHNLIVDRPAPQAFWAKTSRVIQWQKSDLIYNRNFRGKSGWSSNSSDLLPQNIGLGSIRLELRPSSEGQLGVFPEQLTNWQWMAKCLQETKRKISVLNGFAYTGAATLLASAAHEFAEICHVDASQAAVNWARHNARLSNLLDRPIRWIVDDVLKFLRREIKRGKKYDAFILDPPAFGRGQGNTWKLEKDLPVLIECVSQLLSDEPGFVLLSCHSPALKAEDLVNLLEDLPQFKTKIPEGHVLTIPSTTGNDLPCGISARVILNRIS